MKRLVVMVLTVGLLTGVTPALAQSAPLTSNPRSAAAALARGTALATSFPLPTGVAWTTTVTKRPDLVRATQTVVVSRRARGSHSASSLLRFFSTHPVAGMVVSAGQQLDPTEGLVEYSTKAATDTSAELSYSLHGGAVQLELDITIGWTPVRPADTVLPTTVKGVTVEVWPAQDLGGTPVPAFTHRVIHATGPAVTSLVRYLDGLTARGPFPFGAGSCTRPLFYGSSPRMTFRTAQHVVVFQYVNNCQTFNVSVDGKHRPALEATFSPVDPTRLVMTRLLHLVP